MTASEILSLTAVQLGKKIKEGEVTSIEAVKAVLSQIKAMEPELNSYVTIDEEGALKQAEEIQKRIESGELTGPLAGVPAAVKDNICVEGLKTTCSSKILSDFVPTYTAKAVENL
ncbi:MAG: glutamyl-tRNA(Gln) amidotransferase, subunit, partial [Lacrimispora sp.]|nr:glutamyl-tRNA(Gln) amidotransferase, subunit [Lacrimispora sp.]